MLKLIVSDLDGTLLDKKQRISPLNMKAIKTAQENGVRFMIATGRNYDSILEMFDRYAFRCDCMLQNGAEIRNMDGEVLARTNLEHDAVRICTQIIKDYHMRVEYMTDKGLYTLYSKEEAFETMVDRMHCLRPELPLDEVRKLVPTTSFFRNLHYADSLDELLSGNYQIGKMILFNDDTEFCLRLRKEFEEKANVVALSSFPTNVEINHPQAQKGIALKNIIGALHILPSEVAVFGDGLNDWTLFTEFENSYAPSNAEPAIKEMAKEIIGYHDADAVGKKILELLGDA